MTASVSNCGQILRIISMSPFTRWPPFPAPAMAQTMFVGGDVPAGQFGHMMAVSHDDDPVAVGDKLVELGRDHQQRHALLAQLLDQSDDLGVRPDIDAACRLVENEEGRVGHQPARPA